MFKAIIIVAAAWLSQQHA